jgi:hypothetical protein
MRLEHDGEGESADYESAWSAVGGDGGLRMRLEHGGEGGSGSYECGWSMVGGGWGLIRPEQANGEDWIVRQGETTDDG